MFMLITVQGASLNVQDIKCIFFRNDLLFYYNLFYSYSGWLSTLGLLNRFYENCINTCSLGCRNVKNLIKL